MKAFFYNFVTKLLHLSFFSLVQISNYCCICLFSIVPDFTHTFFFPLCFILNSFHCYVFYFINVFFQSVYSHGILSQYIFILKYICFHILEFDLGNYISSMSLHNFFNIWNIVIIIFYCPYRKFYIYVSSGLVSIYSFLSSLQVVIWLFHTW